MSKIDTLSAGGSHYTLAERAQRDVFGIGICPHSSKVFNVEEVDKINLNKVKPGALVNKTMVTTQDLYPDAQFFYAGGALYFTSTVPRDPINLQTYNTGRDLFVIQNVKTNESTLGDWAQDI